MPYFNPRSFRDMLVRHAMTPDLTPGQMKAWSQNIGHADVMTTFTSYGQVPLHRQGHLIRASKAFAAPAAITPEQFTAIKALAASFGS